jgi:microcystin-dependent protein
MADCFIGEIRIFAGLRLPEGWVFCEGQMLSIHEFEALYSLIGTQYGGDGVSTFALPDMRGRVPIHMGQGVGLTTRVLGQNFGVNAVTLTEAQMPSHSHAVGATSADATSESPVGNIFASPPSNRKFYVKSDATGAAPQVLNENSISSTGEGRPHENRMPGMAVNFMIATRGLYPVSN